MGTIGFMKKIYLTSYTNSGVAWLENCLIELNIRMDAVPAVLFQCEKDLGDGFSLYRSTRESDQSRCALPTLSKRQEFRFRNDIFVHFLAHQTPPSPSDGSTSRVILFVRDPRDCLYSEYSLRGYTFPFMDYAKKQVHVWMRLMVVCLQSSNIGVFRFEDYKINPQRCLEDICCFAEIPYDDALLANAVLESSSEKARLAEKQYLSETPQSERLFKNVFNRSGLIGQWKALDKEAEAMHMIFQTAGPVLRHLGYLTSDGSYKY